MKNLFLILLLVLGVLFFGIDSVFAESTYYVYIDPLPEWASYASNVMYLSTTAWQEANEGLNFRVVENPSDADFRVQWVKEFGVEHVGYAFGSKFIEVGLGDSNCMGQWNPYSEHHISEIMSHEIGHILGLEHSDDPKSIMYPTALNLEYGLIEQEYRLTGGYGQFVPFCTIKDITSYDFSIKTTDQTHGFDYYIVPSGNEFKKWSDGKEFQYYSNDGCFGKGFLSIGQTCEGLPKGSGIMILMDDQLTSPLETITVTQMEKSIINIKSSAVIKSQPVIIESEPVTIEPSSDDKTIIDNLEYMDQHCKTTFGSKYYYDTSNDTCLTDSPEKSKVIEQASQSLPSSNSLVQGTHFILTHGITGGSISEIIPNTESKSLLLKINSNSAGTLTINLPREVIDSKTKVDDDNFFVLVNGKESGYEEISSSSLIRTLKINFPSDTDEIEIIGTFVVPEFGSITIFILISSIIPIILISRVKSICYTKLKI